MEPDTERGPHNNASSNGIVGKIFTTRRFYSPIFQVLLISFIFFLEPGMYNALVGMGGSGQVNSTVAANANVGVLAGTAGTAFWLAPVLFDLFGPKLCLLFALWGYPLYSGSLLSYNKNGNGDFVIASGGLLGVCAGIVWIAQGSIMVSYPHPDTRGRSIAIFWLIFNLGGAVGSFASFGINYNNTSNTVTDSTYIAFLVLMCCGWGLSVFIAAPKSIIRSDGSGIETFESPHKDLPVGQRVYQIIKKEVIHFIQTLFNWKILCLLPMFFSANFFYSYQQNIVNGEVFNVRSRALNSAWYWLAQCFGGLMYGFFLDYKKLSRPARAKIAWITLFISCWAIWGGGYAFQLWADDKAEEGFVQWIDFKSSSLYAGPAILYMFYGGYDAAWQSTCYYLFGSLFDDTSSIAKAVGLYKAFQATGGAIAWRINALSYPAMEQFAINWGLVAGSLIIAIPTVWTITPIEEKPVVEEDVTSTHKEIEPDAKI